MSRTVHHVPTRHRTVPAHWSSGLRGPCTDHTLTELRYAREELTNARCEGRRPIPIHLVRTFAAYTYPRALNAQFHTPYESRARADLRSFRTTVRKLLRAAPPEALLDTAETLDHPPTRHRHRNLWEC
ncbi:hypothetical protein AB0D57_11490 [Streptomyces sp. NPDC048275]|uniref:hypothetical protein n=1 Tax=Streptomyces sp. NPDC048275 TaxID=3155629 RepID=UPI0033F21A75